MVVEGQINTLENDFLIGATSLLINFECNAEIVNRSLNSEILTVATMGYLSTAQNLHVVTLNTNELALIQRKLIVKLILLAIIGFKRYFETFDICISERKRTKVYVLDDPEDVLVALVEHVSDQFAVQAHAQRVVQEGAGIHGQGQEG